VRKDISPPSLHVPHQNPGPNQALFPDTLLWWTRSGSLPVHRRGKILLYRRDWQNTPHIFSNSFPLAVFREGHFPDNKHVGRAGDWPTGCECERFFSGSDSSKIRAFRPRGGGGDPPTPLPSFFPEGVTPPPMCRANRGVPPPPSGPGRAGPAPAGKSPKLPATTDVPHETPVEVVQ